MWQTDGRTDRQTDRRTTDKVIPKWRSAMLAPQKNVHQSPISSVGRASVRKFTVWTVGSSPTVSKKFSFCILSLSTRSSWQVDWCHTCNWNQAWHSKHDRTFYLIWYLKVKSKDMTSVSLCYLYIIAIIQYVTQNSKFTRQNTLHLIILELIPMYTCLHWYRKYVFVYKKTFKYCNFHQNPIS